MAAHAEPPRRERRGAAPERRPVDAAFEADARLVGSEAEGRRAVARAPGRFAAEAGLRSAGGTVGAGAARARAAAAAADGATGPLRRGEGVRSRPGEDRGEVGGAVVVVVPWLQQARAAGGDRAAQGHPVGDAGGTRRR